MPQIDDSTKLSRADWENGVLEVEFKSGAVYRYHDVPSGVFNELMASDSKGKFHGANIHGVFEVSKVTPDE